MTNDSPDFSHASAIEALLFLSGEPVPDMDLAKTLGVSADDISRALQVLGERLAGAGSGLRLVRAAAGSQLATSPEQAEMIERFIKEGMREQLTPAASETLAIIAYRGPIRRAGVEAIRGVNSSFTLRQLTIRGLVERRQSEKDSRVYEYRASAALLRHLGLTNERDLPDYGSLHAHEGMTVLETQAEDPASHVSAASLSAAVPPPA